MKHVWLKLSTERLEEVSFFYPSLSHGSPKEMFTCFEKIKLPGIQLPISTTGGLSFRYKRHKNTCLDFIFL